MGVKRCTTEINIKYHAIAIDFIEVNKDSSRFSDVNMSNDNINFTCITHVHNTTVHIA